MPLRYRVRGGRPLAGSVRPAGNKNAALPAIAATLLADGPVELANMPRIRDVETMLALVADLGASVEWIGPTRCASTGAAPASSRCRPSSAPRSGRPSSWPARCWRGSARSRCPRRAGTSSGGGGWTPISFPVLEQLGASLNLGQNYEITAKGLVGTEIFLDEPSVTGTENALMAAVRAKGRTVLRNAAAEPHVQDVARLLVAMGADIEGIGTNVYTITGGKPLGGAIAIGPHDHGSRLQPASRR